MVNANFNLAKDFLSFGAFRWMKRFFIAKTLKLRLLLLKSTISIYFLKQKTLNDHKLFSPQILSIGTSNRQNDTLKSFTHQSSQLSIFPTIRNGKENLHVGFLRTIHAMNVNSSLFQYRCRDHADCILFYATVYLPR